MISTFILEPAGVFNRHSYEFLDNFFQYGEFSFHVNGVHIDNVELAYFIARLRINGKAPSMVNIPQVVAEIFNDPEYNYSPTGTPDRSSRVWRQPDA